MKLKIMVGSILCAGLLASCTDQMDYKEYTLYEKDYVDNNFDYTGALVTKIYTYFDQDFGSYKGAMLASATDEAEYAYKDNSIYKFFNGGWSPVLAQDSIWKSSYAAIQQSNLFLQEFQGLEFPEFVVNDDYIAKLKQYRRYPYEVRALRAYFYFNLVKQYGDVPLFTNLMSTEEVNSLTRKPAQEVFKFIIDECDDVIDSIPMRWSDVHSGIDDTKNAGRINRLFVLALKARASLYAASPLFNANNDTDLWRQAMMANKAVIDSAKVEGKALGNYGDIWAESNYKSSEIIFAVRLGSSNKYEKYNFPMGVEGGQGGNCPTQNLVDAYEMTNGKAIDEDGSGYDAQNPYANRDPRLALTVALNGDSKWPDYNTSELQTYYGGLHGEPLPGATPTGYYLKKQLNRAVTLQAGKTNEKLHNWVTFRLGEFYLNYAEAAFKYTGSADMVPANCELSARAAVNVIRQRKGINMPVLDGGLSADAFWKKYENERFVELAFEGHRFWDLRRWKQGDKLKSITEMKITKNVDGTFTYTRKTVSRQWDDKMYLFPIPQSERLKNPNLTQNPGWE
nr:RagB/SusD family nutrient uptake outer membrane protein [Bacteroides intestinalis]